MKRKNFELWEKDFILLAAPEFKNLDIAVQLGRTKGSIQRYVSFNKIKREKYEPVKKKMRFGKLVVIKEIKLVNVDKDKKNNRHHGKYWLCQCDCGNTMKAATNTLVCGHSSSCGCGRIDAISSCSKNIPGWYYGQVIRSAYRRNIEFAVTIQYIDDLLVKQNFICALSGVKLVLNKRNIRTGKVASTASLDRIDSNQGYIVGNLQWVHADINKMKLGYRQEYFLDLCNLISQYRLQKI